MEIVVGVKSIVEALEGIKFALWYVVLALISLCGITIAKR